MNELRELVKDVDARLSVEDETISPMHSQYRAGYMRLAAVRYEIDVLLSRRNTAGDDLDLFSEQVFVIAQNAVEACGYLLEAAKLNEELNEESRSA